MSESRPAGAGLEILDKADAILRVLESGIADTAATIADTVGEPTSSTHRLLANLRQLGWVDEGNRRGTYRLGLTLLQIGSLAGDQRDLQVEALPRLQRVRRETGLTTYLCVRVEDAMACVGCFDGRSVQALALRLGGSLPLDRGAVSRAFLAATPRAERDRTLERLGHSAAARARWQEELDAIRDSGISISDEDVTRGIGAVGAVVLNHRGEPVAAISVSGLRDEVLGSETVGERVRAVAEEISRALGYVPGGAQ
ncbi:IclR family transcriptional regulator [Microbacterium sp. NPDC058342]|uniref:IclR family transcriptional regulator n=1 Tax=Microbacterium sp. NPDC058342 TaxID=3346454 RepID=UPI00365CA124